MQLGTGDPGGNWEAGGGGRRGPPVSAALNTLMQTVLSIMGHRTIVTCYGGKCLLLWRNCVNAAWHR